MDSYDSPLESAYGHFVVDVLAASSSDWVLDDGCGNARFSIILAGGLSSRFSEIELLG